MLNSVNSVRLKHVLYTVIILVRVLEGVVGETD